VDVGQVYKDQTDFSSSDLRYSVGLSGLWISPFGPLSVSLAYPLNDESGDDTQYFQFTIGTLF
jgi:outer membrane protein insertion porin family